VHLLDGVRWSVQVTRIDDGFTLLDHDADQVCQTASIGKILLLLTVAEQIVIGSLDPALQLPRPEVPVADSGLWQHLSIDQLTVADACTLVGSVSDNLATNALIDLVGLPTVADTAGRLGLNDTALHDIQQDRGLRAWNKTGTNDGVRCDVGVVRGPRATLAYAVLANWVPSTAADPDRDLVLEDMRGIGASLRSQVTGEPL
jgi:beta-lactamase class A